MWALIIKTLGSILGGPFITAALQAYQSKLAADTSDISLKEQLAVATLALQGKELELQTQYKIATAGSWWLPDHIMGYTVAIYFAKLLVWDKVLAWGTTDPLAGWAATSANLIVAFYFGKVGIENIVRIWSMKWQR